MKIHPELLAAAVAGVLLGASGCASKPDAEASHGSASEASGGESHSCKGMNGCKGMGGCKTDQHACKGQNECKGQGGCKTA